MQFPTEAEWEFATCNGKNSFDLYSWGNALIENKQYKANVWQGGQFDTPSADGIAYLSPIDFFGSTPVGLTDMGGNVCQWCSDSHRLYNGNRQTFSFDINAKVIRGGSFLFDQIAESTAVFALKSPDMNEGYPGNMEIRAVYAWTEKNVIVLDYVCTTDK